MGAAATRATAGRVEGTKGDGRALTQALLAVGETVVDVATHLTVDSRRRSPRRGMDDEGDAIAIARVALREDGLPQMNDAHLDADLKLLVDARDQLVAEQGRVRNRLHALMLGCAPGHRATTGALISKAALARARSLALKARSSDPVRAQLSLAAIRRLSALTAEIREMEGSIARAMATRPHDRLLAIPGVGPSSPRRSSARPTTSDISRARPPSPRTPGPPRSRPRAATPPATASRAAATANSTAHCSPSPWSRPDGTLRPASTSQGNVPKARPAPRPGGA